MRLQLETHDTSAAEVHECSVRASSPCSQQLTMNPTYWRQRGNGWGPLRSQSKPERGLGRTTSRHLVHRPPSLRRGGGELHRAPQQRVTTRGASEIADTACTWRRTARRGVHGAYLIDLFSLVNTSAEASPVPPRTRRPTPCGGEHWSISD
jgi:hypothetical protein